jgi:hypothetical protein
MNGYPSMAIKCPYCDHTTETQTHYLSCQHTASIASRDKASASLRLHLQQLNTDNILQALLLQVFTNWRTTPNPACPITISPYYHKLFKDQSAIGWDQIIKGRFALKWVSIQQQYILQKGLASSGTTWASAAI